MILKICLYCAISVIVTTQANLVGDKARNMCNHYSSYVYVYERSPALLSSFVGYLTSKCAVVETTLIIGGNKAQTAEFPHMVAIGFEAGNGEVEWLCGGSLISEKYVLSAAHCVRHREYGDATRVMLGANNLRKMSGATKMIRIKRTIQHPKYIATNKYHDIALFELVRKLKFNEFIRPACLNTNTKIKWSTALASGYGQLFFDRRQRSDHLMKVTLKNINSDVCKRTYPISRYMPNGLIKSQFCAGDLSGKKDTCKFEWIFFFVFTRIELNAQLAFNYLVKRLTLFNHLCVFNFIGQGDSGGPLQTVLMNPYCMYNIIGITSFGRYCGFENAPGIYTSVAHYIDWIESIVWP